MSEVPSSLLNRVFPGPVEDLLPRLPDESVDCIFADPDYNVGIDYHGTKYSKPFEEYIAWSIEWSKECHRILKTDGNFFILNYGKNNAHLRAGYLDRAFVRVYEYVWVYNTNIGQGAGHFTSAHRILLHCVKSTANRFYKGSVAEPYQNPRDKRVRRLISEGSPGRMPYSWIEGEAPGSADQSWISQNLVKNVGLTKTFHSCQIPETLSEKLLRATTRPGDTVLVLFGGAGSELVVCQRLGLNWVSAEIVPEYRQLIEARLKAGGNVPRKYRMMTVIKGRQRALDARRSKVKPIESL